MDTLAIGEVARRVGIRASAIRYYERVGLLPEPRRVGGKRRYDEGVIQHLALIGSARRIGLSIQEIQTLFHGFPAGVAASERWRTLVSRKMEEVDELIAGLREMRSSLEEALRCECASLDECARVVSRETLKEGPTSAGEAGIGPSGETL